MNTPSMNYLIFLFIAWNNVAEKQRDSLSQRGLPNHREMNPGGDVDSSQLSGHHVGSSQLSGHHVGNSQLSGHRLDISSVRQSSAVLREIGDNYNRSRQESILSRVIEDCIRRCNLVLTHLYNVCWDM